MKYANITPMAKRKYAEIPVDRIKVLNPRTRDRAQFKENVRSIKEVGLLKPVVVNGRNFKRTGYYELVCGQGRFLAYKELGRARILAEIISCSKKEALLYSLVENIARIPPRTMWFAREVQRMHDAGLDIAQIAKIVGKGSNWVRKYVKLVEQGEARLIRGVEQGLFPISFALMVAQSDNSTVQNVLMDAFDNGIVTSGNFDTVRKVLDQRTDLGKDPAARGKKSGRKAALAQLKSGIAKSTREKASFVRQAKDKENRLMALLDGVNTLWKDKGFVSLVKAEGLGHRPKLEGQYGV
jgi:ParB family chromosome partitioning protein